MTICERRIQILYMHLEVENELTNYLFFVRLNLNYFLFTYYIDPNNSAYTERFFENLPHKSDHEKAYILIMEIKDFSTMYKVPSEKLFKLNSFKAKKNLRFACVITYT